MIKPATHVRVLMGTTSEYGSLYSKIKDSQRFKEICLGIGEMALRLKAHAFLAKDLGLIPKTHMEAYNVL